MCFNSRFTIQVSWNIQMKKIINFKFFFSELTQSNNLSFQISWTSFSYFLNSLSFQRFQVIFQWKRMCPCVTMAYHSSLQYIFLQFQRSIFGSIFFKFYESQKCWTISAVFLVFFYFQKYCCLKNSRLFLLRNQALKSLQNFQVQNFSTFSKNSKPALCLLLNQFCLWNQF